MKRCLVCCGPMEEHEDGYHPRCSARLFGVRSAPRLTFTWDALNEIAEKTIRRSVSVPGVQPKLSVHLERADGRSPDRFTLVGLEGELILKPPSPKYPEMPELEHACMTLASRAGIETAVCGLVTLASDERAYLTRRMDRVGGRPLHMEDMCQLTDRMTEEKYRGSMERIGKAVLSFSSNPGFDAIRFLEAALFCFITGNADMHLKNFSLLYDPDGMIRLSPAYDLLPTRLLMPEDQEEMALTLNGRKSNLHRKDFDAFAATMGLSERQIANTHDRLRRGLEAARGVVSASFLSLPMQQAFLELVTERSARLWSEGWRRGGDSKTRKSPTGAGSRCMTHIQPHMQDKLDPELQNIAATWPLLPRPLKNAVLAIINTLDPGSTPRISIRDQQSCNRRYPRAHGR